MIKSLLSLRSPLASGEVQLDILHEVRNRVPGLPLFTEKLRLAGLLTLKPTGTRIFQVNIGKMCNQACRHCHVDAGPDRREIMTYETLQQCLDALRRSPSVTTVDITGGAPEMNPNFRWFVEEVHKMGLHIMVRCNLTIILANKRFHDLPEFFRAHHVEVVSSLPHFSALRTDRQRGEGVFEHSITALKMLNAAGYGNPDTGLMLNLVYNPSGAFLPGSQTDLEKEFKSALLRDYGIVFNNLFVITNMPISRYLEWLISSGNLDRYMETLANAFNPTAAAGVMCRNTISVGWDGRLYDCDFNQMLEIQLEPSAPKHIADFDIEALDNRQIVVDDHCFGCTAGAGSSCGGEIA